MSITLNQAREIIAAARKHGREQNLAPLTVAVLDTGGSIVALEREDGSALKRAEIAVGKAHGAIALGMGSRALMNRAETQAYFIAAAQGAIGGSMIPVPGGVLIRDGAGELLGAVGISGDASDADEAACVDGIEQAGLVAQVD